MKLLEVELNKFRNFGYKKIDFKNEDGSAKRFVAIIGDNGVGKTSILEAITRGYTPIVRSIAKSAVVKCDLSDQDIYNGDKWTAVRLTVCIDDVVYRWFNRRRSNSRHAFDKRIEDPLDLKRIKQTYEEYYEQNKVPLVLYYGINRVVSDIPKRGHIKEYKVEDALRNCFDNINYFRDFYEWFKTQEDIELREQKDNPDYINSRLDAVRIAISSMIPGYGDLRIKLNPARMIVKNKEGQELRIEQLSGGYKAILSLVADIAKRLSLANPTSECILDEEAIILIDELDLHLHPKWQKTIAQDLKRTFPNCQFIVTTHSPFIVQSLHKEEVINLEKEAHEELGSFEGWSIEDIQQYEMGVKTKTDKYKELLSLFSNAVDDEDSDSAQKIYSELINMIHPDSSEKKILDIDMAGLDI